MLKGTTLRAREMAEKNRAKKKRPVRHELKERRFLPEQTHTSRLSALLGMAGSLALGAGVYGQWVQEEPMRFAPLLVAFGALTLGVGLWLGTSGFFPVRVGDAGVAIERGTQVSRLRWCDIQKVSLDRGAIVLTSSQQTLSIALGIHPKAAAVLVAEAERRIPKAVHMDDTARKRLVAPKDGGGELVPVEDVQIAGHRCAASNTLVSFERDARLCPNCGQVYHREHVPKKCVTCEVDLTGKVLSV